MLSLKAIRQVISWSCWAVSFVLALIFFQIRKLTVGAWPWQRGEVEAYKTIQPEIRSGADHE